MAAGRTGSHLRRCPGNGQSPRWFRVRSGYDVGMRTLLLLTGSVLLSVAAAAEATVAANGKPAFALTLPAGWTAGAHDGITVLRAPEKHPHVQVWATTARDLAAATTGIATLVSPEVMHFTTVSSEPLTVAGAPATALVGTGEEADDGDPSQAEAVVFTVKGTVFVLLAHGEGEGAAQRRPDLRAALATIAPLP